MKSLLLFLVLIFALSSCNQQFEDPDRPDLLVYRYHNGYNNAAWGEYSQMFTKDIIIGGANFPLIQGNTPWVNACIGLRDTGLKLSFYGEKLEMRENIGTISGFYTYYYEGREQEIAEVGYFQSMMVRSESGKWKFDNLLYNKVENEYCISAKWWRENL